MNVTGCISRYGKERKNADKKILIKKITQIDCVIEDDKYVL